MTEQPHAVKPFTYPRLRNVTLLRIGELTIAFGYVYNDRRFSDGAEIKTSAIQYFSADPDLNMGTLMHTRNTIYQVESFRADVLNSLLQ
jgi:hypothetical protein